MRGWVVLLLLAPALAGCLGTENGPPETGGSADPDVEPGCTTDETSGQLTPQASLTVRAEAKGSGASAQFNLEHAGAGTVQVVLDHEGDEIERWETSGQGVFGNNAHGLGAGDYTLTASVQGGVHQVQRLSLEISWGDAECQ